MNPNRFQEASFEDVPVDPVEGLDLRVETPFLDLPETALKPPYFLNHVLGQALIPLEEGKTDADGKDRKVKPECVPPFHMVLKGIQDILTEQTRSAGGRDEQGGLFRPKERGSKQQGQERRWLNFIREVIGFHVYTEVRSLYKKEGIESNDYNNQSIFETAWHYLEANADDVPGLYADGLEKLRKIIDKDNQVRQRYNRRIEQIDRMQDPDSPQVQSDPGLSHPAGRSLEQNKFVSLPALSQLIDRDLPFGSPRNPFVPEAENQYLRRTGVIDRGVMHYLVQAGKQGAWDEVRAFLAATPVVETAEGVLDSFNPHFLAGLRRYFLSQNPTQFARIILRDGDGRPTGVELRMTDRLEKADFVHERPLVRVAALQMAASLWRYGEMAELSLDDIDRFYAGLLKSRSALFRTGEGDSDGLPSFNNRPLVTNKADEILHTLHEKLPQARFSYLYLEPKEDYSFYPAEGRKGIFQCQHPELSKMSNFLIVDLSNSHKIEITLAGHDYKTNPQTGEVKIGGLVRYSLDRVHLDDTGQVILFENEDDFSRQNAFIEQIIEDLRLFCVEREAWPAAESERRRQAFASLLGDMRILELDYPRFTPTREALERTVPEAVASDHTLTRAMTPHEFELFAEHVRRGAQEFLTAMDLVHPSYRKIQPHNSGAVAVAGRYFVPQELKTPDLLLAENARRMEGTPFGIDTKKIPKGLSHAEMREMRAGAFPRGRPRSESLPSSIKIMDALPDDIHFRDFKILFDFEAQEIAGFIYDAFHFRDIFDLSDKNLEDLLYFVWSLKVTFNKDRAPAELADKLDTDSGGYYCNLKLIWKGGFEDSLHATGVKDHDRANEIVELRQGHAAQFLRQALRYLEGSRVNHQALFQAVRNLPKSIWYFFEMLGWEGEDHPLYKHYKAFNDRVRTVAHSYKKGPYKKAYSDLIDALNAAEDDLADVPGTNDEDQWQDKLMSSYQFLQHEYRPDQLKAFAESEVAHIQEATQDCDPYTLFFSGILPKNVEGHFIESVFGDNKLAQRFEEHLLAMNDMAFERFLRRQEFGRAIEIVTHAADGTEVKVRDELDAVRPLEWYLMNLYFKLEKNMAANETKCLALMNAFHFYEVAIYGGPDEGLSGEIPVFSIADMFLLQLEKAGNGLYARALDLYFREMGSKGRPSGKSAAQENIAEARVEREFYFDSDGSKF